VELSIQAQQGWDCTCACTDHPTVASHEVLVPRFSSCCFQITSQRSSSRKVLEKLRSKHKEQSPAGSEPALQQGKVSQPTPEVSTLIVATMLLLAGYYLEQLPSTGHEAAQLRHATATKAKGTGLCTTSAKCACRRELAAICPGFLVLQSSGPVKDYS